MLLNEILVLTAAILSQSRLASGFKEYFDERLYIKPLRDGRVAAHFSFTASLKGAVPRSPETLVEEDVPQHYTLFPLSLGQVLREHSVTEMHLNMNAGKWDYQSWGYPDDDAVATGAELWAWMGDSSTVSVDDRWKGLRNSLAGLFCASLGSLDDQRTTSPAHAFRPEGNLPSSNQTYQIRHASLPSEHVCTENLTPFLKLLPCKSASGIASLLNPHRLFDADWHGIGVHVWWRPTEGISMKLSIQAVFDPVRLSFTQKRDFSLRSLFDRTISKSCPIARESVAEFVLPDEGMYSITPEPQRITGQRAVFDINEVRDQHLDISLNWPEEASFSYPLESPNPPLTDVEVVRTLTGSTQSRGQLAVLIRNNLQHEMHVVYLETMPWLVQFYLHTARISVDGSHRNELMRRMAYIPAEAHGRPTLFEALLVIPPMSTLELTMDVTKSFLRYTEHPPDAQRGWDLPSAVIVPIGLDPNRSATTPGREQARLQRIYSPTLLIDVATPDFSMPYNVIIMSSTLIALIFGSIFNLLTRKFIAIKS